MRWTRPGVPIKPSRSGSSPISVRISWTAASTRPLAPWPPSEPIPSMVAAGRLGSSPISFSISSTMRWTWLGRSGWLGKSSLRCRPRWYAGRLGAAVDRLPGPPAAGEVVVPEQAGRDGPPRPPDGTESGHLHSLRPMVETLDLRDGGLECHVARRPDIGASEDHQQVDRLGPRPDARDGLQRLVDGVVVESGKRVEIERSGLDRL